MPLCSILQYNLNKEETRDKENSFTIAAEINCGMLRTWPKASER